MSKLITSAQLIKRYGSPLDDARTTNVNEQTQWEMKNMTIQNTPAHLLAANAVIPKRLYGHKDFIPDVLDWLQDLLDNDLLKEINEWNGIFSIRLKRGLSSLSTHAFGCAVDANAKNNPLGVSREQAIKRGLTPFSHEFICISRKYFDCGADWKSRPDGMHFQMKA
jgi:hypothetical protein